MLIGFQQKLFKTAVSYRDNHHHHHLFANEYNT